MKRIGLLAVIMALSLAGGVLAGEDDSGISRLPLAETESRELLYSPAGYIERYDSSAGGAYRYLTGRVWERGAAAEVLSVNGVEDDDLGLEQPRPVERDLTEAGLFLPAQARELARQLLANDIEEGLAGVSIVVSSFVNLNRLYSTSGFGRFLAEQLISELQQAGVRLVEVRKTPAMMIREGAGEYSLSRDLDQLSFVQNAQAVLVGTYLISEGRAFVNARLIRNQDNLVISSAHLDFMLDRAGRELLGDEKDSGMGRLEREAALPIRNFPER